MSSVALHGFGGGGGASLNFKVVGNPQPASPIDNTIWISTDKKISSYIFSASEPENPSEGMVWISTGTSSTVAFSATKKNPVMIYPLSAKQCIDGALVDVPAKSYQGGAWRDWWNGELYDSGNEFESITGGWALSEVYSTSHGDTLTKNENNMVFSSEAHSGSNGFGFLRANNKQDLTNIKTLYLVAEASIAQYSRCAFCASSVDSGSTAYNNAAAKTALTTVPAETIISLDVSGLSGLYYVGVAFGSADDWGTSTVIVDKIRME